MTRVIGVILISVLFVSCGSENPMKLFTTTEIVVDSGEVSRPTVSVDEENQFAYWSWIRKDGEFWNVYVSRYHQETSRLHEPVRVNHIDGNASPHDQAPSQVVVGTDGAVFVAWTNSTFVEGRRFPASNLLFSRSLDGGKTFSQEKAINSDAEDAPAGHTFHNVLTLSDGTILVSWIDSRNSDAFDSAVASTSTDRAISDRGSEIWIARSVDNGLTFEETAVVDHNACPCCRTQMVTGPDGSVYLAWRHEFENGARDIVLSRSVDGGFSFSDPVRVWEDNWVIEACPHAGPSIGIEYDGTVHVSWFTGAASGIGLFRASSDDLGMTFQDKTLLDSGRGISSATFAPVSDDQLAVVFEKYDSHTLEVVSISRESASAVLVPEKRGEQPSFSGSSSFSSFVYERADSIVAQVMWSSE